MENWTARGNMARLIWCHSTDERCEKNPFHMGMFSDVCSIFSLLCMPLPLASFINKKAIGTKSNEWKWAGHDGFLMVHTSFALDRSK